MSQCIRRDRMGLAELTWCHQKIMARMISDPLQASHKSPPLFNCFLRKTWWGVCHCPLHGKRVPETIADQTVKEYSSCSASSASPGLVVWFQFQ